MIFYLNGEQKIVEFLDKSNTVVKDNNKEKNFTKEKNGKWEFLKEQNSLIISHDNESITFKLDSIVDKKLVLTALNENFIRKSVMPKNL